MSEPVSICRGDRKDCVMLSDLFSFYSEVILSEAEGCRGVMVDGVHLTNIRYADDTVLLSISEREMQTVSDIVNEKCKQFHMSITAKKTEVMIKSRTLSPLQQISFSMALL